MPADTDRKYVTFRRADLLDLVGQWTMQDMSRRQVPKVLNELELLEIHDAVVMRLQDSFAGPCLATYASMIGLVAAREADAGVRSELLDIADYFDRMAEQAGHTGNRLPTL